MTSTNLPVLEELVRYVVNGEKSPMIAGIESLNIHNESYDLKFLFSRLLTWTVASPLLRSALLRITEQDWYPILVQLVSTSTSLSVIWSATITEFQFNPKISDLEAEAMSNSLLAIYKPHVSSTIR